LSFVNRRDAIYDFKLHNYFPLYQQVYPVSVIQANFFVDQRKRFLPLKFEIALL